MHGRSFVYVLVASGWKDIISPWMHAVQREGHRWWDGGGEQASTGVPWEEAHPLAHIKHTHTIPGCPTPVNAHVHFTLDTLSSKKTGLQRCQSYNTWTEELLQPWVGFSGWSRRAGGCIFPSRLLQSGYEEEAPFSQQDPPCPHQKQTLVEERLWTGEDDIKIKKLNRRKVQCALV